VNVIDVIMFRDELGMLEGRLRELDGVVSRHVIVEAPVTHRGDPKPLHFMENRERFSAWQDKITPVVADGLPASLTPWAREHAQRDAAMAALDDAADDDIVLIADVDEFPPQGYDYAAPRRFTSFNQRLAMYAVDWLYPDLHICTVAARMAAIRGGSLAAVRDRRYAYYKVDGGWHLTWLGGQEGQEAKLAVTCHDEMTPKSRDLLASGRCYRDGIHHTGDFGMVAADVDETWPGFIYRRECPENWFRPR
jgi:hypothetical protein